jgi:hypothetical protein
MDFPLKAEKGLDRVDRIPRLSKDLVIESDHRVPGQDPLRRKKARDRVGFSPRHSFSVRAREFPREDGFVDLRRADPEGDSQRG